MGLGNHFINIFWLDNFWSHKTSLKIAKKLIDPPEKLEIGLKISPWKK